MAHKRKLAAALVSWSCMQAGSAWGLGLGELTMESFLNEPLQARVSLLDAGNLHADQIRVRLATSEDFDRLGVDRAYFLTGIKFDIELDNSGRGVIVLRSEDPVLEPFLDFIVETRWPSGRVLRNYTVLVDPPVFDRGSPAASASRRVADVEDGVGPATGKKKADTETRPGTAVATRRSGLAPGAMPQRDFSAGAAAEAAPGSRYMIRRDDTLWAIAQRARPEGISVHQTMLEIQRLNPEAFLGGNINRIKAGYVVYLPASNDIGSTDLESALTEVRQQNEDWRAGRPSATASDGPALRISSADMAPASTPETQGPGSSQAAVAAGDGTAAANAALEGLEKSEREREELGQRLQALNERLETLERIVELKDARIASLQQNLAAASKGEETGAAPEDTRVAGPAPAAPAPTAGTPPAPGPSQPPVTVGGTNWLYGLGAAVVAALLGLLLWRRRRSAAEPREYGSSAAASKSEAGPDPFANVELKDQALVEDIEEPVPAFAPAAAFTPEAPVPRSSGERGYGERKHDEYASDVEAGGALAEVDIYIAYGRFSQAMELLRNALRSEPDNTAYRLKLLELAVETADRAEADRQLEALQRIGDADAIARAQVLAGAASAPVLEPDRRFIEEPAAADREPQNSAESERSGNLSDFGSSETKAPVHAEEDLSLELDDLGAGLADERGEPVPSVTDLSDSDFLGLDLEDDLADDFSLPGDTAPGAGFANGEEEDFVFAEDGDPLSTKLDLARAYIDMGDDDGARQILTEVVSGGSAEQQEEARELLGRLG